MICLDTLKLQRVEDSVKFTRILYYFDSHITFIVMVELIVTVICIVYSDGQCFRR